MVFVSMHKDIRSGFNVLWFIPERFLFACDSHWLQSLAQAREREMNIDNFPLNLNWSWWWNLTPAAIVNVKIELHENKIAKGN